MAERPGMTAGELQRKAAALHRRRQTRIAADAAGKKDLAEITLPHADGKGRTIITGAARVERDDPNESTGGL